MCWYNCVKLTSGVFVGGFISSVLDFFTGGGLSLSSTMVFTMAAKEH